MIKLLPGRCCLSIPSNDTRDSTGNENHTAALKANIVKRKVKGAKGSRSYSYPGFCASSAQITPFVHVITTSVRFL